MPEYRVFGDRDSMLLPFLNNSLLCRSALVCGSRLDNGNIERLGFLLFDLKSTTELIFV